MTATAMLDQAVTHAAPFIDPQSLSRGQRAGRRCAVPNCRRRLGELSYVVGRLPTGRLVLACPECASGISFETADGLRLIAAFGPDSLVNAPEFSVAA